MINIIDACVILFLLLGTVIGYKRGAIQSICVLVGTIGVIILASIFKNPLGSFMYKNLPFFEFKGFLGKIPIINILIYRAIAFIILLALFSALLSIILKFTGIISKIVDHSIILTLPSKLIGMAIGFVECYIFIFIFIFIFSQLNIASDLISTSKLTNVILTKTPFTINGRNSYKAFKEIDKLSESKEVKEANEFAIDILKNYNLVNEDDLNNLAKKGKIVYGNEESLDD